MRLVIDKPVVGVYFNHRIVQIDGQIQRLAVRQIQGIFTGIERDIFGIGGFVSVQPQAAGAIVIGQLRILVAIGATAELYAQRGAICRSDAARNLQAVACRTTKRIWMAVRNRYLIVE